jgi:hypothetical protein
MLNCQGFQNKNMETTIKITPLQPVADRYCNLDLLPHAPILVAAQEMGGKRKKPAP